MENVFEGICVYTGAIDELFGCRYGTLPYRSLRFEWKSEGKKAYRTSGSCISAGRGFYKNYGIHEASGTESWRTYLLSGRISGSI